NGISWETVNNGLPQNPWISGATGSVDKLVASGNNVFTSMSLEPEAYYLSTDNGSNWTSVNVGAISGISALAVARNNFFIGSSNGIYISSNNGTTWTTTGLTDSAVTSFALGGTNLYASTNSAIYLSTNNGITWTSANSGLPNSGIIGLSANGNYVIAKTSNQGFFLSTNNGTNWDALSSIGLPANNAVPGAFTPLGTNLFYGSIDWGIYRSTDNGKSWAVANTGLEETSIMALAATRNTAFVTTPNNLYASSQSGIDWIAIPNIGGPLAATDSTIYGFNSTGICYSTNTGKTWNTPLNTGIPTGFAYTTVAVAGTNFYLGTQSICGIPCGQGGVYLSTNGGISWNKKGLSNISTLVAFGTDIYAVSLGNSLYVSTAAGSTWNTIPLPSLGLQYSINAIVFRGSEMFIGFMGLSGGNFWGGVLRSFSGGIQWDYIDNGLPGTNQWVTCLALRGTNIFAGTTAGIYVLNNDDASWTAVNTGLPLTSNRIDYLAVTDSNLYADLRGIVWKRPISEMITTALPPPMNTPMTFSLSQNYPNPFNPYTIISYQIASASMVTLKVYDVLGREVATLVNEVKSQGNHTVTFNAINMASGVYFYRLQSSTFTQTKKMLLLK
ncbi:MAG: T9SS type A sorting domain-containing protein, partial [Bacteroidota bacterium]